VDRFKKGKILTTLAIIAFVVAFLWGRNAQSAEVGLGLGFGTFNAADATIQELSVITDDLHWFASYSRVGGVDSDRLQDKYNDRYVIAYRVFWRDDKDFRPYLSLGVAYFDKAPERLISEHLAYDLRLGVRWKDILELDVDGHNSTAGRSERNTGIDSVNLRIVFQF